MADPRSVSESNAEVAAGGLNPEESSVSPMPGEDGKTALKADRAGKHGEAVLDTLSKQNSKSPGT